MHNSCVYNTYRLYHLCITSHWIASKYKPNSHQNSHWLYLLIGVLFLSVTTATRKRKRMARREEEKVRGVFEHPTGSGVWWINYYAQGQRHREKDGRNGEAVALYQKRKADR